MKDYQEIPGWFDYQKTYDFVVNDSPPNAVFVELGCWQGKSTCYFGQQIKKANKGQRLYAVDWGWGSTHEEIHKEKLKSLDNCLANTLVKNLRDCDVADVVVPIITDDALAVSLFAPHTLNCVFIDTGHTYAEVKRTVAGWLDRVKLGGIIAGHDYNPGWPGVVAAVHEIFTPLERRATVRRIHCDKYVWSYRITGVN